MKNQELKVRCSIPNKKESQILLSDVLADIVYNRIDKLPDRVKGEAIDMVIDSFKDIIN